MMDIPLLDDPMEATLKILIDSKQIHEKVKQTAKKIEDDYRGKDLVIVTVLKGALCLVADLIREINLPLNIEVVQCSSYGERGTQRGGLTMYGVDRLKVHNRDVLIVDDIFDSGQTMSGLYEAIGQLRPRTLKSCVFLKKISSSFHTLKPDYTLFDIGDEFVVGYGLDYKEQYRGLPDLYSLGIE